MRLQDLYRVGDIGRSKFGGLACSGMSGSPLQDFAQQFQQFGSLTVARVPDWMEPFYILVG
jgi:hypothetical protein